MANGTGRQTPPNTAKHRQRTDEVLAVPLAPLGEPPLRRADGVPAGPIWSYHRIASTNQYPMTMGTTLSIVHHMASAGKNAVLVYFGARNGRNDNVFRYRTP